MESKNVKVIDEHNIDRVANILCSIDVDGSDYVIYWIERDNDNDNLFVSKIIKNNDMTASMVNIEDSMEKSKVSDIVKELVTYAVNNQADKLAGEMVSLPDGKNIKISSVVFNKDQNINVQKTYITTVKKTVSKVSGDFYKTSSVASAVTQDLAHPFSAPTVEVPTVPAANEELAMPNLNEVTSSFEPLPPAGEVNEVKVETPVLEVVPPVVETPSVASTPVPEPVPTPVVPSPINVAPTPVPGTPDGIESKINIVSTPTEFFTPADSVPQSVPVVDTPVVAPAVESVPSAPASAETTTLNPLPNVEPLIFDASKETNLNKAMDNPTDVNNISVQNVEPLRDFGQDENAVVPDNKGGFANNKFFIVVAIAFFIASCVFLGYEVFKYFQIVK